MKAFRVIISGDVQGVGYRSFLLRHAQKLGAFGWVKNRDDGCVEAHIQGDSEVLRLLLSQIQTGPETGWVRDVQIKENAVRPEYTTFQVIY